MLPFPLSIAENKYRTCLVLFLYSFVIHSFMYFFIIFDYKCINYCDVPNWLRDPGDSCQLPLCDTSVARTLHTLRYGSSMYVFMYVLILFLPCCCVVGPLPLPYLPFPYLPLLYLVLSCLVSPVTPFQCRLRDCTYSAPLWVNVRYTRGRQIVNKTNINIGRIPVMLLRFALALPPFNILTILTILTCSFA